MDKGYYKDPKTGEIKPGSFEDAWRSFVGDFKDDEEFEDAKEADRLEKHPEKDIIKKIQKMVNKEKKSSNK